MSASSLFTLSNPSLEPQVGWQLVDPRFVMPEQYLGEPEAIRERVDALPIAPNQTKQQDKTQALVKRVLNYMYLGHVKNSPLSADAMIRAGQLLVLERHLSLAEMYMFRYLKSRTNNQGRAKYGEAALRQVQKARFRCEACGMADVRVLHIDHIHGRQYDNTQFQLLCANCHSQKTWATAPPISRVYDQAILAMHAEQRLELLANTKVTCTVLLPAGSMVEVLLSPRKAIGRLALQPQAEYTLRIRMDEVLMAYRHKGLTSQVRLANCCCMLESIKCSLPSSALALNRLYGFQALPAHSLANLIGYANTAYFQSSATPSYFKSSDAPTEWAWGNILVVLANDERQPLSKYLGALPLS